MNAKRGSTSTTGYTLSGKSLQDLDKEIGRKGPRDPNDGKRYAGSCLGSITLAIAGSGDVEFEAKAGASPIEMKARLKGGSLTSSCKVTLPRLASDKNLSTLALKEWKRFLDATSVHEDGHADSCYALAVTIAGEMVEMTGTGTGKDEKAAKAAAQKALFDTFNKTYGGKAMSDRINADIKRYDDKTRHGESQGAKLKTSVV